MNGPTKTKSRVILIADDDEDSRMIIDSSISMQGYQTVVAKDGTEACKLFSEHHPDVAVLDFMMPGMAGPDVCKWIKSQSDGALIPVIMLTARTDVKDKVLALEGGADDYLTKPFHYQELQARINALLRVRDLNLVLKAKNDELTTLQGKVVAQERQLAVHQLAGTAAHQLGQPLAAIMLNCHLIENLPPTDPRHQKALMAVKSDAKRMGEMIERLKRTDAGKPGEYFGKDAILKVPEE